MAENKETDPVGSVLGWMEARTKSFYTGIRMKMPQTMSRSQVFVMEAKSEKNDIYWRVREVFFILAVYYVIVGFRSLIFASPYEDTHHWPLVGYQVEYTFSNSRFPMIGHFLPAAVFMGGCLVQKEMIPRIANNYMLIKYHRWIGRVTLIASAGASFWGFVLSLKAIHETESNYFWWAVLWMIGTVMAYVRAKQGDFAAHRRWANMLFQTCLLFITARGLIMVARVLDVSPEFSYQIGVAFSGRMAIVWFIVDLVQWKRIVSATNSVSQSFRSFVLRQPTSANLKAEAAGSKTGDTPLQERNTKPKLIRKGASTEISAEDKKISHWVNPEMGASNTTLPVPAASRRDLKAE